MTFPARLGGPLGAGYVVRNYLLKNGDSPYWRQAQYEQSLEWNPDIVVIMLGTQRFQNIQLGSCRRICP